MKALSGILLSCATILFLQSYALGAEVNCLECHDDLAKEKYVHPALQMGCTACHEGIDASVVPHKKTTKFAKGLSADQPELCFNCHDKKDFTRKTVHPALEMGCTSCHNPHSSKIPKLLTAEPPKLCYGCHEQKEFTKKNVHEPVSEGMCMTCHLPHSSDHPSLLAKEPIRVCLDCHPDVRKTQHAASGYDTPGHPIGLLKRGSKEFPEDPARPGKRFYCGSCHNPHSSDWMYNFRYKASTPIDICINCHKK